MVFLLITDDQRWCKEVLVPKHRKIDDLYIVSYPSVDENDVNGYTIQCGPGRFGVPKKYAFIKKYTIFTQSL